MFRQLGLIGCGLMGGSFALALKRAGLVQHVVGYSKSPSTVLQAQRLGVVDQPAESALLAVAGSDIVLIAVPVAATEATFRAIRHLVHQDTLFMDVGSTKHDVVEAARRALKERVRNFVPAHPVAGKEKSGIAHADAALYRDCRVVLTPIAETDATLLERARAAWTGIGAQVVTMTAQAHDDAFAAVSHLPHLLAYATYLAVARQPEGRRFLELAGPGFRDFTRIAASDAAIWRDILLANRTQVLHQSELFRTVLAEFEDAMKRGDAEAVEGLIAQAARGRAAWQPGGVR
ncbi:MAG TPA: prephenate dehydrogenase/arogenate dehydrogenase family protein [Burkholderiaceae bacterium]|jgi:prephenate dehydrogenase|nr:prephenate dehydrogenase/arogenate dehydrogenase family protein [Burkholderiaceae bacterium]